MERWFLGLFQVDPLGLLVHGTALTQRPRAQHVHIQAAPPCTESKVFVSTVLPMRAAGSCSALGWFTDLCSCAAVNQLSFAPAIEIASYKTGIGICKELRNLSNFFLDLNGIDSRLGAVIKEGTEAGTASVTAVLLTSLSLKINISEAARFVLQWAICNSQLTLQPLQTVRLD